MKHLAFATGVFVSAAGFAAAETPELVVYTTIVLCLNGAPGRKSRRLLRGSVVVI